MRREDLRVNITQEELLRKVNSWLAIADATAASELGLELAEPSLPIVFVVGPPRSGTTITMQWLAHSGEFAYPTNLAARFYEAPLVGALVERLLTDPDLDFNQELSGSRIVDDMWTSDVGKTRGWLQPHEFSFFWRRYFPMQAARRLSPQEWESSDLLGFANGLALIQAAAQRPLALKGILAQYNIPELAALLPSAVFVHTHRDPFFNVQSLLKARERVYGDRKQWFSVEHPGHEAIRDAEPIVQVVDQVMTTNFVLRQSASFLGPDRWIDQPYEAFCQHPGSTWEELRRTFASAGHELPERAERTFTASNNVSVDAADAERIRSAIAAWRPHPGRLRA